MKRIISIACSIICISFVTACSDRQPTNAEATSALRTYKDPMLSNFMKSLGEEEGFQNSVVIINSCEKSDTVAGWMCSTDVDLEGKNNWHRNRLVGFSKSKDGTWNVSRW